MPYECHSCQEQVPLDVMACPVCGALKTAWTMADNATRQLKVARKGLEVETSTAAEPVAYDDASWERASEVRALSLAHVRAQAGQRLAPRDVLRVCPLPRSQRPVEVTLSIYYDQREARDVALEVPAGSEALFLCFVRGDASEVALPGARAIDVAEEGEPGHAPEIGVTAHALPPRELPLVAAGGGVLAGTISFGDEEPQPEFPFWLLRAGEPLDAEALRGLGGTTQVAYRDGWWWSDAQGAYRFEGLPPDVRVALWDELHPEFDAEPAALRINGELCAEPDEDLGDEGDDDGAWAEDAELGEAEPSAAADYLLPIDPWEERTLQDALAALPRSSGPFDDDAPADDGIPAGLAGDEPDDDEPLSWDELELAVGAAEGEGDA